MDLFSSSIPLFVLLTHLQLQVSGMKCFICSFSPKDRNNRTDKCTDDNFQPHDVYSDDCKFGCESLVQYDANGELEQWRRNCLQSAHKSTNECQAEKMPGWTIVRCTCNSELCNDSTRMDFALNFFISLLWLLKYRFFLKSWN